MTGLDTVVSGVLPEVDMQVLYNYCQGEIEFPEQPLHDAGATGEQIALVKSLLLADPRSRATASSALRDPAVALNRYRSGWCTKLQLECSDLGLQLDIGSLDQFQLRKAHAIDLTSCLVPPPSDADLRALLDEAYRRGYYAAGSMLLNSRLLPSSVARGLFEKAFDDRRVDWIDILSTHDKIKIDESRIDSRTALGTATYNGWTDIAQSLLQSGANANLQADGQLAGEKPLLVAARQRDTTMVKLLLEHGASVDDSETDSWGWTALQQAVDNDHIDVVRLLLDNRADVDARSPKLYGWTALQAAAASGHIEIVHLLISYKADVNAAGGDKRNRTALELAMRNNHPAVVALLQSNGAINNNPKRPTILEKLRDGPPTIRMIFGSLLVFIVMLFLFSYGLFTAAANMPVLHLISSVSVVCFFWAIALGSTYMLLA